MNNSIKVVLGAGFAIAVAFYVHSAFGDIQNVGFLMIAAVFGAYMAMNIGANDVANNVGPAVGAGALTIGGAIVIASVFEALGALIAGGDVVKTIKKGIIDPSAFAGDPMIFVYAMAAALLAAALWLTLATILKAPVSTTHSIVGGVMGAGIAAGGFAIVSWGTMGKIAASWVISPLLGGLIAAGFLYIIKSKILYNGNMLEAAKKVVPVLVSIMTMAFITYLTIKGLKKVWVDIVEILPFLPETKKPTIGIALMFGTIGAIITYIKVKPTIAKKVDSLSNNRASINTLFTIPLIFAAALLSFAHGANDVANAVGPLAAIFDSLTNITISAKASIPLWVMVVGGIGISVGLTLFGPRLIKTVGSEITELDQMRAFSIMMAAAITVVIASQLGLPVSSTHIAVGGVFGVGFLREWLDRNSSGEMHEKFNAQKAVVERYKQELIEISPDNYKRKSELHEIIKVEKKIAKTIKKSLKEKYVKRGMVKKIIAAWVITVPVAAVLSAVVFFILKGMGI
jgi:PiT family inorganic phosphate transporter